MLNPLKISNTPLLSQPTNYQKNLAAAFDEHRGFNLDAFNNGEESTLDDRLYNVVADK
jgi:hypothetical protein